MSTPTLPNIEVIPSPPVHTLAALRSQHSALLQRTIALGQNAKPSPGELLGFLESASNLGRSLGKDDDRETAQGIMDYWVAPLLSQLPDAADSAHSLTLEPFDEAAVSTAAREEQSLRDEAIAAARRANETLTSTSTSGPSAIASGANALYGLLPPSVKPYAKKLAIKESADELLRRLLLRFVHLKEKSLIAYSVPLSGDDEIFQDAPEARSILDTLITAGLVREQATPAGSPAAYVLTHESLLTESTILRDVVAQRKAFRELARGWNNASRPKSALLTSGEQIERASDYPHLDAIEGAFVKASRHAGDTLRAWIGRGTLAATIILLTLLTSLTLNYLKLSTQQAQLLKQRAEIIAISHISMAALSSLGDQIELRLNENRDGSRSQLPTAFQQLLAVNPEARDFFQKTSESAHAIISELRSLNKTEKLGISQHQPLLEFIIPINTTEKQSARAKEIIASIAELQLQEHPNPDKPFLALFGGIPLPRFRPATDDSNEVRYFNPEDKALAESAISKLIPLGFNGPGQPRIVLTSELDDADHDTPVGLIQIAVSAEALN